MVKKSSTRPLPGGQPAWPVGMANYVVTLKEQALSGVEGQGRRALFEANSARAAEFRKKLFGWLEACGLLAQVAGVGEPMGFPMITLTTTPRVAETIKEFPEVESVFEDTGSMGIIR